MYAIVDIETTGGKYNEEGITEIAIQKFDGVDVVDCFVSLINPERDIQPFVVQLTGINNKMLKNAPKFYEVAKRIVEITKDCVLVAHNSNFDYRILKTEFRRLGFDFERPTLCTVELSKKLIPNKETYSLGKLCRNLGIPISDRHRANGDAMATLKLFEILLAKDSEKGIVKQTIKTGNNRDLSQRLLNLLDELPKKTGVFYFHDYKGKIIYIGRAKSIYKEVNKLFLDPSKSKKALRKQMSSVSFELTGNALIAEIKWLEETHLHSPKYNRLRNGKLVFEEFSNNNMLLIDKGRSLDEKSVILIENNEYQGFTFTDLNYQINHLSVLKELITPAKNGLNYTKTINHYLKNNKIEKFIRF